MHFCHTPSGASKQIEQEDLVDPPAVQRTAVDFYDTIVKHFDQWSGHLTNLDRMPWTKLKQVPKWLDVEKTMEFVDENECIL